jgi:hypothetical protein
MDPPVPIPNTEVKHFSADGTAWGTMWESRSPPKLLETPVHYVPVFFFVYICIFYLYA